MAVSQLACHRCRDIQVVLHSCLGRLGMPLDVDVKIAIGMRFGGMFVDELRLSEHVDMLFVVRGGDLL